METPDMPEVENVPGVDDAPTEIEESLFEPRGPGAVVTSGIANCVSHGGAVFILVALLLLPAIILSAFQGYVAAELGMLDLQEQVQSGQINPAQMDVKAIVLNAVYSIISGLAMGIGAYFALAGAARTMAERAVGRPAGPFVILDALLGRQGRNLAGAIISLVMICGVVCVVGAPVSIGVQLVAAKALGATPGQPQTMVQILLAALIGVPVLLFATYLVPMASVTGVEDRGAFAAVGRSFGLVSGNFGRSFAVVLAGALMIGVPLVVAGLVMQKYGLPPLRESMGDSIGALVAGLPSTLLTLILLPFMYSIEAALYFDLRARKWEHEDFTPEDLALDLGYAVPSLTPGGPLSSADADPLAPAPPAETPAGPEPPSESDLTP